MLHQIVIPSHAVNSGSIRTNMPAGCMAKLLNVHLFGSAVLADTCFLLQSNALFQNMPNNQLIIGSRGLNDFSRMEYVPIQHNGEINLTCLEYDRATGLASLPLLASFRGLVLTFELVAAN